MFSIDRNNGVFHKYHNEFTTSRMLSLFISYYSVGALGGFTIGTGDGGGKGVMGPSTAQITFQKVDLYIDDSNFV